MTGNEWNMRTRSSTYAAPLRVVFLGTPAFAVAPLRVLLESPATAPVLVVTQPDRPAGRGRRLTPSGVKTFALAHDLPICDPERLRGGEVLEQLRAADADLFVIAAYGQLLRREVLDTPRYGCLNIHPSLLPRHRGPAPIAAAILAGDAETGVTIMLTDRGMDTGPIIAQRRIPLGRTDTTASLTPTLFALGADLLIETIPPWVRGEITPRPQDASQATLSRLFTKEDGAIDWTRPALAIERQVRALNPWPRAYTFGPAGRLLVLAALAVDHDVLRGTRWAGREIAPGQVVSDTERRFLVATGEGLLRLDEIQPEGRRAVPGAAYLAGNTALLDAQLGPR